MTGFGPSKNPEAQKSALKRQVRIDVDLLFQEALRHQHNGHLLSAETAYEKIIKSGYLHSVVFLNLADICQETGRLRKAISRCKQAVSLSPDLFDARMKLGALYKDIGDLDQSRNEIMRALSLEPNSPCALLNIMSVYRLNDIPGLKSHAFGLISRNSDIIYDLNFVEFLSSLGAGFCEDVLQSLDDSVASREA
ncbi:hypothetical protein [Synechococcus sp. GEYO]|uniref:hypothetical protein n=1 Tax=Synechococcus sp. GEYO TaxID=2575511 RepID=UPI000E0EEA44|nr:hypothetical protein [Synechococcus sp. GEYO]